jgi:5-methylcytosine-specific restriction endonuclease McrA
VAQPLKYSTSVDWRCIDCGTTDKTLQYKSGKMKRCYDCQNYANLKRKVTKAGHELGIGPDEFREWKRAEPSRRRCTYCGNSSEDLHRLAIPNVRTGKRYESIGVDRPDNSKPYTIDNIVPCCGPCNSIKGTVLTKAEMEELGEKLAKIWKGRLSTS